MDNKDLINKLYSIIEPLFQNEQIELYHIEFVKEDGENYLRIYIYREAGISLNDCETISRKISDVIDTKDPIETSYYLEVSSPGLNRTLYNDKHLLKVIGNDISIFLIEKLNSESHYLGRLISFDDLNIVISVSNKNIHIPREKIKSINLEGEL
jgi:ribosome maturation factor RimP